MWKNWRAILRRKPALPLCKAPVKSFATGEYEVWVFDLQ